MSRSRVCAYCFHSLQPWETKEEMMKEMMKEVMQDPSGRVEDEDLCWEYSGAVELIMQTWIKSSVHDLEDTNEGNCLSLGWDYPLFSWEETVTIPLAWLFHYIINSEAVELDLVCVHLVLLNVFLLKRSCLSVCTVSQCELCWSDRGQLHSMEPLKGHSQSQTLSTNT